jgi:hypothetical protein
MRKQEWPNQVMCMVCPAKSSRVSDYREAE